MQLTALTTDHRALFHLTKHFLGISNLSGEKDSFLSYFCAELCFQGRLYGPGLRKAVPVKAALAIYW